MLVLEYTMMRVWRHKGSSIVFLGFQWYYVCSMLEWKWVFAGTGIWLLLSDFLSNSLSLSSSSIQTFRLISSFSILAFFCLWTFLQLLFYQTNEVFPLCWCFLLSIGHTCLQTCRFKVCHMKGYNTEHKLQWYPVAMLAFVDAKCYTTTHH